MKIFNLIRRYRKLSLILVFSILCQLVFPIAAHALTSGPTQPEVQSFEPIGATEMVDNFSGDFSYNIPLFEVPGPNGGYPVNLFYNSVTGAEEEASMVGLGWNIGIGNITRQVRGLPDDFNGDKIKRKMDMKDNITWGVGVAGGFEFFGADFKKPIKQGGGGFLDLGLGFKLLRNSYKGWGYSISPSIGLQLGGKSGPKSPSFSGGFGIDLNSMEGASANANFSISKKTEEAETNSVRSSYAGFGVGLNSRSGLSMSLSGGSSTETAKTKKDAKLQSTPADPNIKAATKKNTGSQEPASSGVDVTKAFGLGVSSSNISPENEPLAPQVSMPFRGYNAAMSIKGGFGLWGGFVNLTLDGFFNRQFLKDANKDVEAKAFGYLYTNHDNKEGVLDFGRENDGNLIENHPNLPVPYSTPDIFSVTGHGIGGSFRAYRSDIPTYFDQRVESVMGGGALGIEVVPHFGIDGSANFSMSVSEKPDIAGITTGNSIGAKAPISNDLFEPYYFKHGGEMTSEIRSPNGGGTYAVDDSIGTDYPVYVKPSGFNLTSTITKQIGPKPSAADNIDFPIRANGMRPYRKPRNSNIQQITNKQLLDVYTKPALAEYGCKIVDGVGSIFISGNTGTTVDFNRTQYGLNENQIAGFTVTNDGGARWVYGLPVKNFKQVESTFSLPTGYVTCEPVACVPVSGGNIIHKQPGTDQFLSTSETPEYVPSYMLTTILGADFVDMPNQAGDNSFPSLTDKGYWMAIKYIRTSDKVSPYKWRTPFAGANRQKGYSSLPDDDKGSFVYGEREQYYPGTIRTRTHEAEFFYSRRNDARGANTMLQNPIAGCSGSSLVGAYSYKLDSIRLKTGAQLLKTVVFVYGDVLCPGALNQSAGPLGKLTLKKLYFKYENNGRGATNAYNFEYFSDGVWKDTPASPVTIPATYSYSEFAFDRWGIFRPNAGGDPCSNQKYPFVQQNDPAIHTNAGAWHLRRIILPSGSSINIDVERDDYAYVQDRIATQMHPIAGLGANGTGTIPNIAVATGNPTDDLKIFFNLETPTNDNNELRRYFDDLFEEADDNDSEGARGVQLFYKLRTKLTTAGSSNNLYEDVSGYAYFNKLDWGFDPTSVVAGKNTRAWVKLKPFPIPVNGGNRYHPMLVNNWQYLKVNLPDQMYGYNFNADASSNDAIVKTVKKLSGLLAEFGTIFTGYYKYCFNKNYGRTVDLANSYIRLNTPDRKKYGDGIRVKSVVLRDDAWDDTEEKTPAYGVVYQYDTDELEYDATTNNYKPTGRKISSGVATNEPGVGSEENAIKYVKSYVEELKYRQDQFRFFEYPINESYYPGASVGYSKVTMMSLPSYLAQLNLTDPALATQYEQKWYEQDLTDYGFATSGMTVHEFYTAKDFPVITRESDIKDKKQNLFIPIPLIGMITKTLYTGSQGYTIELNNMHGKPKAVTNYGQTASGAMMTEPISYVKYEYRSKDESYTLGKKSRNRKILDNDNVDVLVSTTNASDVTKAGIRKAEMAVDRELFFDVRRSSAEGNNAGIQGNVDWIILFGAIPIPSGWLNIGRSKTEVLTAVSNKVIYKSGILVKTEAKDGQSLITTENKVFDRFSGQPLLTTVTNLFDDKIYNYSIPAYAAYSGMGPAYNNSGLTLRRFLRSDAGGFYFNAAATSGSSSPVTDEPALPAATTNALFEGDEFLVSPVFPKEKATINRKCGTKYYLEIDVVPGNTAVPANSNCNFFLQRSGRRNQQSTVVGQIAALADPTINRSTVQQQVVALPKGWDGFGIHTYENFTVGYQTIGSVLSATASVFTDKWPNAVKKACADNYGTNTFANGIRGIWRPSASLVYVDNRQDDLTLSNFKNAGKMDNVSLFDWKNPYFLTSTSAAGKWKKTEDIMRYGENSNPLETRDVLGNYSAAVYGYNENVPVIVGSNAGFHEVGFEGFEERTITPVNTDIIASDNNVSSGNLEIGTPCQTKNIGQTYNIMGRLGIPANPAIVEVVIVDRPYLVEPIYNGCKAYLELQDEDGVTYYYEATLNAMQVSPPSDPLYVGKTVFALKDFTPHSTACLPTKSLRGRITLSVPVNSVSLSDRFNLFLSNKEAHTGNNSFLVKTAAGEAIQTSMKLEPGKTYVLSAWVKVPGTVTHSYATSGSIKVKFLNGSNGLLSSTAAFTPVGPIIAGWQRIENEFTFPSGGTAVRFSLEFQGNATTGVHYDDIRVFPKLGNMQSFVYNPLNYKLTETLDNNNFFTRFLYNTEGALISTQKETLDGVKTVQESGSYIKEQ